MNTADKKRLALTGEVSKEAQGLRLRATLKAFNYKQKDFADLVNVSKTVLNNAVKGRNETSGAIMAFLYDEHEVDFNFIMNGLYNRLPAEVQEKLFDALASEDKS